MNQNLPILSDLAQAALECAARGLHVFPAPPGKKKSYKSAEHSDGRAWGAMTDSAEIARDWRRWPSANLGLVTGPKSGFFVVEADTLDGHGVDGIANLAKLIEQNGDWPETIEALSPSGSWHVWFRWPEAGGVFNSEGEIAPGVDVRGDGGMVLAPPSVKPNAAKPYQWKNSPDAFPLADCPEWLLKFCRKEHKAKRSEGAASQASLGSVSAEDRVRVLTLLGRARNTLARPDWINLCIALKGTLGDVGRGGWLAFSDRYEGEQKPGEAERQWNDTKPKGELGLGTIFHLLRPLAEERREEVRKPERKSLLSRLKSFRDLQRMEFPPIQWIVPGFLPEGLTILIGPPKLGKSWLTLGIARAVASGGEVLGQKVDQGAVILLALEDNDPRLQARLGQISGVEEWPEEAVYTTRWPRLDQGGFEGLIEWLDATPNARLIIIDTLKMVRPPSKKGQGVYDHDVEVLRPLQQLASARGLAILLVHHTKKGAADDPLS